MKIKSKTKQNPLIYVGTFQLLLLWSASFGGDGAELGKIHSTVRLIVLVHIYTIYI